MAAASSSLTSLLEHDSGRQTPSDISRPCSNNKKNKLLFTDTPILIKIHLKKLNKALFYPRKLNNIIQKLDYCLLLCLFNGRNWYKLSKIYSLILRKIPVFICYNYLIITQQSVREA